MPRKSPRGAGGEGEVEGLPATEEVENVFSVKRIVDSDDSFTQFLIHWEGFDHVASKCVPLYPVSRAFPR